MIDVTRRPDSLRTRLERAGFATWLLLAGASGALATRGGASAASLDQTIVVAYLMVVGFAFAAWLAAILTFGVGYLCARNDARVYVE